MRERVNPVDAMVRGTVFDIKRFATGDGPGIRGLVFLKGCPLQCLWCANPESHDRAPEIMYHRVRCVGCGQCIGACPAAAIRFDETYGLVTDREACERCGRCVASCVHGAREMVGEDVSVDEVMRVVRRDRRHYDHSGGGITLTGGEPLLQADFARELLKACRIGGIHTAIETCGAAPWESVASMLPVLNLLFYDLKHINPERHRELTGQGNKLILSNLARAARAFHHGEIIVRIPYIPGCNDEEPGLKAIFKFVRPLPNVSGIEIMPYHRFGAVKYAGLGRDYRLRDLEPVHKHELEWLVALGEDCGVHVRIDAQ